MIVSSQKKRKQADTTATTVEAETESLSTRPPWVIDQNLANMWKDGLSEDEIPESIRLSPATIDELVRLREWAAQEVALQETVERLTAGPAALETPLPPPAAAARISSIMFTPFVLDPASLVEAEALGESLASAAAMPRLLR